ncbi:hypothetical protein MA16_Dca018498 [Dendrobium catenatum]|uniref:Uncharacterized protein n=1 Tax=Dendrobium catenatum TaxID=906689 RepID=A0A2I0VAE4_9ASPA|nr:hypothetical protein MA16_Dca018498 [Dendrobium catenatum]
MGHTLIECKENKKDVGEYSGEPDSKSLDGKKSNQLAARCSNHEDGESKYGPWLQVSYRQKHITKRVFVPKQNSKLIEEDLSIPVKDFILSQEKSVQTKIVKEQHVEALDSAVVIESQPELHQALAPDSIVQTINKFGILSDMEDNNLNCYKEEIQSKDVEEGKITDPEQVVLVSSQSREQELKTVSEKSCKGTSQEMIEVELSSSGKKGKLLKELKSLGSGNIVNYNRKLEVGRSKKGEGLPHWFNNDIFSLLEL